MTTIVKFSLKLKSILSDGYNCNQPKDMSGEYVPLAEYQALDLMYRELVDSSGDAILALVEQRRKLQIVLEAAKAWLDFVMPPVESMWQYSTNEFSEYLHVIIVAIQAIDPTFRETK